MPRRSSENPKGAIASKRERAKSDVAAICRSLPAFFSHDGLDKDVTMVVTSARDLRYKLLVLDYVLANFLFRVVFAHS